MSDSDCIIEIRNLSHRFPDGTDAVKDINLLIKRNTFTVIGGKNGSGKTVLMKHLNGILQPTSGEILVDGISVKKNSWNARTKIGFVFQNSDTQIVAQTVKDDIAFGPENLGLDKDQIDRRVHIAAGALDISGILEHSPHRLSGGEKKKTAIAGVIAMEPELIIFDEPFAGLDYSGVKMLLQKILDLRKKGTAVIVITHDLEKVLAHADRFVVMAAGRIIDDGLPSELLKTAAENGLRIPAGKSIESMSWLDDRL
jgi:biotin transport system ATP-binding protein